MQKLLIIERDTKEELRKAIEKNVLQEKNIRLVSFTVLEQDRPTGSWLGDGPKYFEAWCVISVPDKTDEFYKDVTGMSESEEDRLTRMTGIGTDF